MASRSLSVDTPAGVSSSISVGIVEDEPDVLRRFEQAVMHHPRLTLAFSASSAEQAEIAFGRKNVDVMLVDLGLPDRDGREVIRRSQVASPRTLCMVITMFGDEEHVVSSLEAGAMGYLLKDIPADQIGASVVDLYEGGSPISPSVARCVLARLSGKAAAHAPEASHLLSGRELEALRLIEKGFTYEETAQIMGITWHTVTDYLRRVYRKLEVNSKSQAVYEARQRGILR